MIKVKGYGSAGKHSHLKAMDFERPDAASNEVTIDVLFCGVCHSDVHQVKNEWSNTVYPCIPGHEIVGRVTAKGAAVTKWKVGDLVGVGCMIDSCRHCEPCKQGEENYCEGPNSALMTYNGPIVPKEKAPTHENMYGRDNTFGGYSSTVVVAEDFVLRIPERFRLHPELAAPLLCAAVTTYSPMKRWKVSPRQRVGVVGVGGLGHLAIRLARAMGAEVYAFSTHKEKKEFAASLGATEIITEGDDEAFDRLKSSFDFILSTVPKSHDVNPFVELLKRDRTLTVVGALEPLAPVNNMEVAFHRKSVAGSLIGSIAETQEVLDLCAMHNVEPEVEVIRIQDINDAYTKVEKGEVRFRYVIDMASLKDEK